MIILECRNCPYIKEEVKRMVSEYYQYPGANLSENEIADWLAEQRWCDKVGGKISHFGRCEDAYSDIPKHENHSKQKRRNKRERDQKYKNHIKFLAEYPSGYPSPAVYRDEIFIRGQGYVENPKPYYKRYYRKQRASKYHKRTSNKMIRRYKGDIPKKGNWCHKIYDFWWEMY